MNEAIREYMAELGRKSWESRKAKSKNINADMREVAKARKRAKKGESHVNVRSERP